MKLSELSKPGGLLSLVLLGICAFALTTIGVSREVPVGSVTGQILMEKDQQPLPDADVILTVQGDNDWEGRKIWRAETDEDGKFTLRGIPAQTYQAQVYGKVHSHEWVVQVLEGETTEANIVAKRSDPYLEMNAGSRVYLPEEEIRLRFSGLSDASEMQVKVHNVTDQAIQESGNLSTLLYGIASGINRQNPTTLAELDLANEDSFVIDTRDIEGVFVKEHVLTGLTNGVYLVEAKSQEARAFAWLTVSQIALVTKADNDDGVVYVTDLKTGDPIDGAAITVSSARAKTEATTKNGLAKISGWSTVDNNRVVLVAARHNGSSAYTWFYNYGTDANAQFRASTVTDRPVYRPGDTVHVKTVVRQRNGSNYTVPAPRQAVYGLYDDYGQKLSEETVTVDDFGSVAASFEVPEGADVGSYYVELKYGNNVFTEYLSIASYRKPTFEVKVTPAKDEYVRGDIVKFIIQCTSLTGEPVPGAKLDATLSLQQSWYGSPFDEDYDPYWVEDWGYSGDPVDTFTATTDEQGRAVVEVNTRRYQNQDSNFVDQIYELQANVEDVGGRYYSGNGRALVKRGEVSVEAKFANYFIGEGNSVQANVNLDGQATSLAENGNVTVEFGRMVYGNSDASFDLESKQTLNLLSGGQTLTFSPKKSGSYRLTVTGFDQRGNKVESEDWLWVSGLDDAQPAEFPSLRVVAAQDQYQPGETAEVLIQSDTPGGSVLVTLESEDLLDTLLVDLTGNDSLYRFEVSSDHAPNVYITASRVKDKTFTQSSRTVKVGTREQTINLTVTPDRDDLRPGETVNYTVQATDDENNPVVADVAFGVVDEGIYLIREDRHDPMDDFYPRRWSNVNTAFSFPEIYLDGEDKSGSEIELRQDFEDTAFWNPSVRTNADGTATVPVTLPDNLTTWRATATAVTRDTRVGKATAEVVAQKPVMARISLPQFLVQGDAQTVTGSVVNGSNTSQTITVRMNAIGGELRGPAQETLTLEPQETGSVAWQVTPSQAGEMTFQFTAQGSAESDGVEQKVKVKTLGVTVRDQQSGRFSADQPEDLEFNLAKPLETGTLTVTVSPNLVSALESAVDELVDYPYGCVEQTMSRFVPGVLVRSYLREQNLSRPDLEAKIDEVAQLSLNRLRTAQLPDGGWGWFEYSQPDESMTALVLNGLHKARQAGLRVDDYMVNRGLEAAESMLGNAIPEKEKEWRKSGRIDLTAAVLLWKDSKIARQRLTEYTNASDNETDELARLALGWHSVRRWTPNDAQALQYRQAAYQSLMNEGFGAGSTLSFGDVRNSALALEAMVTIEGATERADQLMMTIMESRTGRTWYDTWRTNIVLQASVAYLRASGNPQATGSAELSLTVGGETRRETINLDQSQATTFTVPLAKGTDGITLNTRMVGTGRPFVSAQIDGEAYDPNPSAVSRPQGFTLKREYFKMVNTRLENGALGRLPDKNPTKAFASGDVFRCRLTIEVTGDVEYVAIEDPIPSNCRIVDTDEPSNGWDWTNWWDKTSFFDDKAVFFVSRLPQGKHVIEYAVRAEAAGKATALPARAYPMYQPDVEARTGHLTIEVKR